MKDHWWSNKVMYQVYPKSFQDSDGDGVGDVRGIIQRLDYLKELGVGIIWVNPIYESPQIDNGYDVSDYYSIDPQMGTMEDVEELIQEIHERGMYIIFDFVMNHTSSEHSWFQEALKDRNSPYRDFYHWSQGRNNGEEPPNNWGSYFEGAAWTKDLKSNEYYLHLFDATMPDLNWDNPEVRQAMFEIAKYWLEKGVDGFRVDAFIHIDKARGYPMAEDVDEESFEPAEEYIAHQPNVIPYMREWRERLLTVKPDVFIMGEASSASPDLAKQYTDPESGCCDTIVSFTYFADDESHFDSRLPKEFQPKKLDIGAFKENMQEWYQALKDVGGPILYWSNHDMPRILSRYGDIRPQYRELNAKMLATLMYLQKGIPLIYYGEEIGQINASNIDHLDEETPLDIKAYMTLAKVSGYSHEEILTHINHVRHSQARAAMQWNDETFAGFSTVEPWNNVNVEPTFNVAYQQKQKRSVLYHYQQVIQLTKEPFFVEAEWELIETSDQLYVYRRYKHEEAAIVICNVTPIVQYLEVPSIYRTIIIQTGDVTRETEIIRLGSYASIVISNA